MPFADLEDVRLFYTDDGTAADVLLLVHGWGADSHEWIWHIGELAADYRVLAVDLRGHGYSSTPREGNRPPAMAADLVGLLDRLGVERVIGVGHSMGGQIVSMLAVEHPERVRALVCVDPGYGQPPETAAYFPAILAALRGDDPAGAARSIDRWCYTAASPSWLREWHTRRLAATAPHVLAEAFAAMFVDAGQIGVRPESEAYLARRGCPVLSFWRDQAMAAWEEKLFTNPASRAIGWPGSGHRLHEERPAEFLLVMKKWLATYRERSTTR